MHYVYELCYVVVELENSLFVYGVNCEELFHFVTNVDVYVDI